MYSQMQPIENTALFVVPLIALLASLVFVPLVRKFALKLDFVDHPGGRKKHEESIPYGGGLAIFIVFSVLSLFIPFPFENSWAFFLSLALILIVGIVDDRSGVNAKLKFFIHFLSAFILVVPGGTQLTTLGQLLTFENMDLGWFAIPFSVMCVVYIINAINMMDGLDGLAGGKSLIIFLWLAVGAAMTGYWDVFLSLAVLSACLIGFLFYNMRHPKRSRACIFLGDAGSMALGLTIAWYAIHLSQAPTAVFAPVTIAWIIALPIVDAFGLLVARLREGKHTFEPDRRHFHHHFLEAGFTPGNATVLILLIGAAFGAIGYFGVKLGIPQPILGWLWVTLWLGHAVLVMKAGHFISLLKIIRGLWIK